LINQLQNVADSGEKISSNQVTAMGRCELVFFTSPKRSLQIFDTVMGLQMRCKPACSRQAQVSQGKKN
jgi:hypothetical protein